MKFIAELDLIIKHLENELTADEEEHLNTWLAIDQKNREYFNQISKIWQLPDSPQSTPDLNVAWQNVLARTDINNPGSQSIRNQNTSKNSIIDFKRILRARIVQAAAVFILLILAGYYLFQTDQRPAITEINVPYTQQKNVTLSDGTQLTLDAGSSFSYPEQFSGGPREVHLNGEAFFEVFADSDRPFIIHANQGRITVLGTSFNIRAWQKDQRVTVAVAEGRVALKTVERQDPDAEVILEKNQVSRIQGNGLPSPPDHADIKSYLSWRIREMYFNSVPLQEVLDQVERWYDVKFSLPDAEPGTNLVTMTIKNNPIEEIIDLIALMHNYNHRRQGNKVLFSVQDK